MTALTKQLTYILGLGLIVTLAACGGSADNPGQPEGDGRPAGISIAASAGSAEAGSEVTLTATVTGDAADGSVISWSAPAGTFSVDSGADTVWTAPAAAGAVTITAYLLVNEESVATDSVVIEVTEPAGEPGDPGDSDSEEPGTVTISISADTVTVDTGEQVTLTATVTGAGSEEHDIVWTVPAGTLSQSSGAHTVWTAPAHDGDVTIAAELRAGDESVAIDSIVISVTEPLAITISAPTATAHYAQELTLEATVTGTGAGDAVVSWTAEHGTLSAPAGATTTWTAPASAGPATITAALTGADTVASLTITVQLCSSGDVTSAADPCIITNVHQLQALSEHPAGHYRLGRDIDARSTETWNDGNGFIPIAGSAGGQPPEFTGSLDGAGYKITGLRINGSAQYVGLFGNIGVTGQVSDLNLVDALITGYSIVGSLAGQNAGTIRDSSNRMTAEDSAQVKGLRGDIGGLVGVNLGEIEGSWSAVPVTAGGAGSGGLVGRNGHLNDGSAVIRRSWAESPLVRNVDHSSAGNNGGLVGTNFGTVTDSYSYSNLLSTEPNTGGLAGYNHTIGLIERSWTGRGVQVTGTYSVGGLVGINWGTIQQSYSLAAEAKATVSRAGGLVGYNRDKGSIIETYSTTKVTASDHRGGLIGEHQPGGEVLRSFWDIEGSGVLSSPGGPGVIGRPSTGQMFEQASYEPHGWDFTAVWQIDEGNDTPELRSNPRPH